MTSFRTLGRLAIIFLISATAFSQNRFAVTESIDTSSPEVPLVSAADIVVQNSTRIGGGGVQWTAADLGVSATANVNAYSDGTDFYPIPGPAMGLPAACRIVYAELTVDRTSLGAPFSVIAAETLGNGAASDTFGVMLNPPAPATLESDMLGVAGSPGQTDLDALGWREEQRFPVFYSLDVGSASDIGASPADVFVKPSETLPAMVFRSAASMGLDPTGDDVDAIAVDRAGSIVFSLARGSISLTTLPTLGGVTAAGLAVVTAGSAVPVPWALPPQLSLSGTTDELNGVRITDPWPDPWASHFVTDIVTGFPIETIRIENTAGGARQYVEQPINEPSLLTVQPLNPFGLVHIIGHLGRPCIGEEFPVGPSLGVLVFSPFSPAAFALISSLAPGTAAVPAPPGPVNVMIPPVPFPFDVTFQGFEFDGFQFFRTNAVSLVIDN